MSLIAKHNRIVSDKITQWFRDGPIDSVSAVVDKFTEDCLYFQHTITLGPKAFFKTMCDATCVMYHANTTNKQFSGPRRRFRKPHQWTMELELQWHDYLHSYCFTTEYWDAFWESIPVESWENKLPNWQGEMQALLVLYIDRDIDKLIEHEVVCEEENGNIVSWEERDEEDDDERRRRELRE